MESILGVLYLSPTSEVTFWSDAASGQQYTDLVQVSDGANVTSIGTDSFGRIPRFLGPDGVTQMWAQSALLTDRQLLVSTDLATILDGKLGVGEPPASHTHAGSDMPSVQRAADQTIRMVFFDAAGNQWPYQADVTDSYPTVPIFWIGNTTVPEQARCGLDYIDIDPLIVPTVPDPSTPPTGEPEPDPTEPSKSAALALPTITVNGASVSVSTTLTTTGGAQSFAFAQIAVRGPSGQNADTGRRANVSVDGSLALTGSLTAGVSGTWTAYGTFNRTGGADQSAWTDGPKESFAVTIPSTPTPPTTGGNGTAAKIADVHSQRSKLPWNSGAFAASSAKGWDQWQQSGQAGFGAYRGRLSDVMLVFNDGAADWNSHDTFYDSWKGWPGIFVWTIPPQPKSSGGNQATASGANNSHWDTVGQNIVNAGMNNNRLVLRLAHECNGNWYPWSWGAGGGAQTFIDAFKNCVNRVKAKAPNILVNICLNSDWDNQGGMSWQQVLGALKNHIDIVGFDGYDLSPGFRNDQTRKNIWYNRSGPQRNSIAAWCRANGKLMSLDEWGLIALPAENGTGGGDDVLYISDTFEWCKANSDILAYESYFYHPGNPGWEHELFKYPNAEAAYRSSSRWGNQ
ncbi:glycoside hydrolase family 26 protein [Kineosporia succinea]|uniref:GH26 domain-containing protein n=1 Tax=Kineosporia succinea TaxID=84632 RepID=A0ABT9NYM2_9ACTN|nr:hypothetical protein [Kineosporia succinea]MDP9825239.1 hypothetical protein [Kineosporia succinea]